MYPGEDVKEYQIVAKRDGEIISWFVFQSSPTYVRGLTEILMLANFQPDVELYMEVNRGQASRI